MDRNLAAGYCRDLMDEYGLSSWGFAFDAAKRRAGVCRYARRLITLSRYFVDLNTWDQVDDTIRHEIAHALAGSDAGHGPVWRIKARAVGAKPQVCYGDEVTMPDGRWRAECPCGQAHTRHRRPKRGGRYRCRVSGNELTFTYR